MKWKVREWQAGGYLARRPCAPSAYIYRSLSWPEYFRTGQAAYEVRYRGAKVGVISFEGKGATVRRLPDSRLFPELSELDLVELALWVSKLRRPGLN